MRDIALPFRQAKPFSFADKGEAYMVGAHHGYRTAVEYANEIA